MGRKVLVVSDIFLPSLLGGGPHFYEVVKDALPSDARIINCRMEFEHQLSLLVESSEWPELPEESVFTKFSPILRTIYEVQEKK